MSNDLFSREKQQDSESKNLERRNKNMQNPHEASLLFSKGVKTTLLGLDEATQKLIIALYDKASGIPSIHQKQTDSSVENMGLFFAAETAIGFRIFSAVVIKLMFYVLLLIQIAVFLFLFIGKKQLLFFQETRLKISLYRANPLENFFALNLI